MLKQAIIQAGGKGTRLGELTQQLPKPLVEVAGKPLLEYQLDWCKWNGITHLLVVVNHLGEQIEAFLNKAGKRFPMLNFQVIYEEKALGTAGIFPDIEAQLDEEFLVLYGDVLFDIDVHRLLHFHHENKADATLVVHPNDHPYDSDLVEVDADFRVTRFLSKPHPKDLRYRNLVNAAFYVMKKSLIHKIPQGQASDFGKDIFPKLVNEHRIFGYATPEYLKDMGTPERRAGVEKAVISGKVERRNLRTKQKAIFLDRDGVLNIDTDLIHRPEDLELYPYTAECVRAINQSDYLSVVTTNQSVIARNLTDLKGLQEIHNKMETELGASGAYLDAIYFCPHHPDGGFPGENPIFKVACDCRKPKPGMLLQAAERFNIQLKRSWMIGDSERDVLAGKAAGVRTIGVKTGHGLKNTREEPDFFFADLQEAVQFILQGSMDRMAREIIERLEPASTSAQIVLLGGNSRSGKTHLSRMLELELEEEGISYFTIHLDDWILPREQRPPNSDVFQNFNAEQIARDLPKILAGEAMEFPAYKRHPLRPERSVGYHYQQEAVVIIEGVIALCDEWLRNRAAAKVYVDCAPDAHKARIATFYRWKGYSEAEIEALYAQRLRNEYQPIAQFAAYADLHFTT